MEDEKTLKDKVKIFLKKQLPVHIILTDGEWLNGYIIESSSDFFMLKEFQKGEMPVFHVQIKKIDKYKEENKDEKKKE